MPAESSAHFLAAYQTAITLWTYEGTLIWSKYNAMLVANSVILAVTGITVSSEDESAVLHWGLPAIGITLCAAWILLTRRGFDNYLYWIFTARELERPAIGSDAV